MNLKQNLLKVSSAVVVAAALVLALTTLFAAGAKPAVAGGEAQLRVAHLAPFAMDPGTAVTVTLDGTPVLTNFEFAESTAYLTVPAGEHLVEVWAGGAVAISATVDLMDGMDYSAIAAGGANGHPLQLLAVVNDNTAPAAGHGKVRFGHLAPFAAVLTDTLADIRTDSGTVVVNDVPYGAVADYMELTAGEYDLQVTSPDGSELYIDLAPFTLAEGDIVYALAVGDGSNQDLDVFAWFTDMEGVLLPKEEAYLRVAHLAPFATDPGTAVTVTLNSTPVLTNFEFGESTIYLTVPSGEHLVEVWAGGAVAISATVTLTPELSYSAIATGGANDYPLNLWLGMDDNAAPAAGNAKVRFGHLAPFTDVLTGTVADIRTDDGTVVVNDVLFGQIASMYMELPAGVYNLQVTSADGSAVYFDIAPFTLAAGDVAYAVAAGDGTNQEIGVFAWFTDQVGVFLAAERNLFLPIINR